MYESEIVHKWSCCRMCGPMVLCGKCGNNCCNAGHGTLADGTECDACASAYEKQDREYNLHKDDCPDSDSRKET